MMTLYQRDDAESERVRAKLLELGLRYVVVPVLARGSGRAELEALSGYDKTPALADRARVWVGESAILARLDVNPEARADERPGYVLLRRLDAPVEHVRERLDQEAARRGVRIEAAHEALGGVLMTITPRKTSYISNEPVSRDEELQPLWHCARLLLRQRRDRGCTVAVQRPTLLLDHMNDAGARGVCERFEDALASMLAAL